MFGLTSKRIPSGTRGGGGLGGRGLQMCWVNLQFWCVLLIWIIVGHGPTVLAVGAGEVGWFGHCFSHLSFLSSFSSLWETARYRLKYCLKGPLSPKQPTKQSQQPTGTRLRNTFHADKSEGNLGPVV